MIQKKHLTQANAMTLDPKNQSLLEAFTRLLEAQQEFEKLGGKEKLGILQEASQPKPIKETTATNLLFGPKPMTKQDPHEPKAEPEKKKAQQFRSIAVKPAMVAVTLKEWNEVGWKLHSHMKTEKWSGSPQEMVHLFFEN